MVEDESYTWGGRLVLRSQCVSRADVSIAGAEERYVYRSQLPFSPQVSK